jgi:hypothetical protein
MAISGRGIEADPFIVHDWGEFEQVNISDNQSLYVKFANPHETGGIVSISGTGTQADPFVCSSTEELLLATGAAHIWHIKLINKELKLYRYADKYCIYDDSLSTIDANEVDIPASITIYLRCNFNGWTIRNLTIRRWYFYFGAGIRINNMRMLNTLFDLSTADNQAAFYYNTYGAYLSDCVIQGEFTISSASTGYLAKQVYYNRCNVTIKGDLVGTEIFCLTNYGAYDSVFNLDIPKSKKCRFNNSDNSAYRCLIRGIWNVGQSETSFAPFYKYSNCILDIESNKPLERSSAGSPNAYNSDKLSLYSTYSELNGTDTDHIYDPETLSGFGLPMGVDN